MEDDVMFFEWEGETIAGNNDIISLVDCEKSPQILANFGSYNCVLNPTTVSRFFLLHCDCIFVVDGEPQFIWCKIFQWMTEDLNEANKNAKELWMEFINQGRFRSTVILDMLIKLASKDQRPTPASYKELVTEYLKLDDLSQKFKSKRFVGDFVDEKMWCITQSEVYTIMISQGLQLELHYKDELVENAIQKYGVLTELIQIKGAISLFISSLNGFCIDLKKCLSLKSVYDKSVKKLIEKNKGTENDVFNWNQNGEMIFVEGTTRPTVNSKKLRKKLAEVGKELDFTSPVDNSGNISTSIIHWRPSIDKNDFLKNWIDLETTARYQKYLSTLLEYTKLINEDYGVVHTKYAALVRNGRAPTTNPNIQGTPSIPSLRELFIPSPNHIFLRLDFTCVELCTLAAVCEARYGSSVLGKVLRNGGDPHSFTAAMFHKLPLEQFMKKLKEGTPEEQEKYKALRQHAKAFNFGIAGGEGPQTIVEFARSSYGINLTLQEAAHYKHLLITRVYPELSIYLNDDPIMNLARNINASIYDLRRKLSWRSSNAHRGGIGKGWGIARVLRGKTTKQDGTPYTESFLRRVWGGVKTLNRNPELNDLINKAIQLRLGDVRIEDETNSQNEEENEDETEEFDALEESEEFMNYNAQKKFLVKNAGEESDGVNKVIFEELYTKFFAVPSLTLTGRLRGQVSYTQARNTPFSGLASDGAKLALWNLTNIGYRIVAFIHDEIILEIPLKTPMEQAQNEHYQSDIDLIRKVACESMQEVCGSIPIRCNIELRKNWAV